MGAHTKNSSKIDFGKFTGFITRASCPPCARHAHLDCVEEEYRKKNLITSNKAHCYCLWTGHRESTEGL